MQTPTPENKLPQNLAASSSNGQSEHAAKKPSLRPQSFTPKANSATNYEQLPNIQESLASYAGNSLLQSVDSFSELKTALANVQTEAAARDSESIKTTEASFRPAYAQSKDKANQSISINTASIPPSSEASSSSYTPSATSVPAPETLLSRLQSIKGNKSATTVGEEYRASRTEKRKSLKLTKQASERNVPSTFSSNADAADEDELDTTKPLAAVTNAISRKISSTNVGQARMTAGNLTRRSSSQNMQQTGLSRRSSSQNVQTIGMGKLSRHGSSQKGSILSIRRVSQSHQSLPASVESGGGSSIPERNEEVGVVDFDFDDTEVLSSGFNDVPLAGLTIMIDSHKSLYGKEAPVAVQGSASNMTKEEKQEKRRALIEEQQRQLNIKGVSGKNYDVLNDVFSIPLFAADERPAGHLRDMSGGGGSIKSSHSIRENLTKSKHMRQKSDNISIKSSASSRNIIAARRSTATSVKDLAREDGGNEAKRTKSEGRSTKKLDDIVIGLVSAENSEGVKQPSSPQSIRLSAGRRTSTMSQKRRKSTISNNADRQNGKERPVSFTLYPRKSIVSHSSTEASPNPPSPITEAISPTDAARPSSIISIKQKAKKSNESLSRILMDAAAGLMHRGSKASLRFSANNLMESNQKASKSSPLSASEVSISIPVPEKGQDGGIMVGKSSVSSSKKSMASSNKSMAAAAEAVPRVSIREQANEEYNQYLLLQQRHDSVNFIHKMESAELVYEQQALRIKFLGPHLLGGQIGKGAFGKVKEGICTESLQRVAVKVMAKKRVRKNVDGVIREIKLLRRLKHENIVKLIDVFAKVEDDEGKVGIFPWFLTIEEEPIVWMFENGEEEEKDVKILKWYIVMEFCPCSLQTVLDHSPDHKIPLSDAHSYFTQLMHGISFLHSQKVIHRDIKPGNLLLTTDGIIKITDFGIAEIFDTYSDEPMNCTMFAGTHQFLSPEVITDDLDTGYDGTKVDVWACGVVLYNLISGLFPFEFDEDPNILQLHEKIVKGEYLMPSEAIFPLDDLINRILKVDPVKRFNVEQILAHPWVLSQAPSLTSGILTYHHSKEDLEGGQITLIPCETTILPYISQLYLQELEQHLKSAGAIMDCIDDEDTGEGSKESLTTRKLSSGFNWIKRHVSLKKH